VVAKDGLVGASKLHVEDSVEDRIDRRVGVAEPEEESVQPVRKFCEQVVAAADSTSDVQREEP